MKILSILILSSCLYAFVPSDFNSNTELNGNEAFISSADTFMVFENKIFGTNDDEPRRYLTKKERKERQKELSMKASKEARKEAEKMEKENGWTNFPGKLPMDKMFEESWVRQSELTADGAPAWITAMGNGVASNQSAALTQAVETAKLMLAGLIETEMTSLISLNIANAQLSTVDAESVAEVIQSAKNVVKMKITRVSPIVTLYRDRSTIDTKADKKYRKAIKLEEGVCEVQVLLFYDTYELERMSREIVVNELKDKVKENEDDLKKLMKMSPTVEKEEE